MQIEKENIKIVNKDMQKRYNNRFGVKEKERKNAVWEEICVYLSSFLKREGKIKSIVDVAAGYCDFINNINCVCRKYAVDLNPDIKKYADKDVVPIVDSIDNLNKYFQKDSVSLFFMSNFLEHITKDEISKLLKTEYALLEEGGEVWILTPNIRYTGEKYWDFYDHITPVTERAFIEEAQLIGYRVRICMPKFLPFTTKSRFPQAKWIVHLYLRLMPLSGKIFGEQSFLALSK